MQKIVIAVLLVMLGVADISPDNICTFHIKDKIFTLINIEKTEPYSMIEDDKII